MAIQSSLTNRVRHWLSYLGVLLGLMLLVAQTGSAATKMLLLNPVRAIFTDRQRTININVSNPTEEPITYTIATITMRPDKNGSLHEVSSESDQERKIREMIRYSPRRATIEPGKRQVVKLMVAKPADLPAGEYQTRLRISQQPGTKAAPAAAAPAGGSSFAVDILVDSTIPIIIQNGDISAEVKPLSVAVKPLPESPGGIAAEVKLARQGTASAFGNLFLTHLPARDPKAGREIGRAQGLALYLPDTERTVLVPLSGVTRQELTSGILRVTFQPHSGILESRDRPRPAVVREFPLH